MDKVVSSAALAVADIHSGASLASGGFGVCGIPSVLIEALVEAEVGDLEVVSNNFGVDDWGLGASALGGPHPPDGGLVRGREQGVRASVPQR